MTLFEAAIAILGLITSFYGGAVTEKETGGEVTRTLYESNETCPAHCEPKPKYQKIITEM